MVLTLMFQQIERSATQVNSLAYILTKVQQLPKTQTHQLINSQTHKPKTSSTQMLINLKAQQFKSSTTPEDTNSQTYQL